MHEEVHIERLGGLERVDPRGLGVGQQHHVRPLWIDWKPRTDEPSNARPSSNTLSSNAVAGIEKCWTTPGRSQNRMSTYSTFVLDQFEDVVGWSCASPLVLLYAQTFR